MLKLEYNIYTPVIAEIEEKLKSLSLQYSICQNKGLDQPRMIDGRNVHQGSEEIFSFLEELNAEMHHWWYCGC